MVKQISFRIIVGIILISISYTNIGCVASSNNISKDNSYILCEEPRPELCTLEYVPVCGKLIDGNLKKSSRTVTIASNITFINDVLSFLDVEEME